MSDTAQFTLEGFGGTVFRPGDGDYEDARMVFNGMIDRHPAIIARCATVDDVVAVVDLARSNDLPLSVYGGGHGVTGSAVVDAGVCLDLRGMRGVTVDAAASTASVEGGAIWGDVDAATQEHGLAVTGGRVSTTGVGGLTLGSGSGWLERKLGFVCDNLLSAQVVTADGDVVIASDDENPDLFWGLRGGGGNFGVVTRFDFRLHPVGPIVLRRHAHVPGRDGRRARPLLPGVHRRPRRTRWAPVSRSSPRRRRTSCPSPCAGSR